MKKIIILMAVASLFLVHLSSAANIGASPASITFSNVLRGGYAERPIRITSDSSRPLEVEITKRGEISDWINLSKTKVLTSKGAPTEVLVSVRPPNDVPNGRYSGFIRLIREKNPGQLKEGATGIVIPTLDIYVVVEITDREIRGCRASNFQIQNAEEGEDLFFTAEIENTGNVRFAPLISLDVWNQDSTQVLKEIRSTDNEVAPTKKEKIMVKFSSENLPIGQYWLEASAVDCYNTQTLTFDILEEGALFAKGLLTQMSAPVWLDLGDTIPIVAIFKNTGEKPLQAKFKGKITHEGKIVQIIESDEKVFVPISEERSFQFYFTPKEAGRYLASGRVFYSGKRTYEKGAAFNVRPKNAFWLQTIKILTYLILIAIIAFLLTKIKKERNAYSRKIRRLR